MKKAATIFLSFFLLINSLWSQLSSAYTFEFFNASHGLPSSEVLSLAKDERGFLWIGTSAGLSKYDGYKFHNYPFTKNGELIGAVNAIKPDKQNRLWVGSGSGLFCLINEEITKVSVAQNNTNVVNDILVDEDQLWISTDVGPLRISIEAINLSGSQKINLSDYILKEWIPINSSGPEAGAVNHMAKAADGTFFLSQLSAIYRLAGGKVELIHRIADRHDQVLSLFPVNQNKIYFDAAQTEVSVWENGKVFNTYHELLYKEGVDDDKPGFWYGSTAGLYYFHPSSGIASRFINTLEQGVVYPSSMLQDDNFFWLATHDGLVKIKPSLFRRYIIASSVNGSEDYYAMLRTKGDRLLFGSNRGKILQKKDTGFELAKKFLVPTADIRFAYEDNDGRLWAASSYQGLVMISDNKVKVFTEDDGLVDNSVLYLLPSGDGKLYAVGDHGVTEIKANGEDSYSFKKFYYKSSISKHAKFFSGITGPDSRIWLAGEEGLVYLENDSLHLYNLTGREQPLNFIIKDRKNDIWIASNGDGIFHCKFDHQMKPVIFRHLEIKDGLNSLNYNTLLADRADNIWAGSSGGITFIGQKDGQTGKVVNFDKSDGFIAPGYSNIALYEDADSTIWVTTTFGIASFKPLQLFESFTAPMVYIENIRGLKSGDSVDINSGSGSFKWNNNSFSIEYTALNYTDQEGIQYYYRLDGVDTNWINAGSNRSVSFASLAPGAYTFHVKAVNNKGRWSEKEAVYNFYIRPPFWKTWWFRLLLLLVAAALLSLFVRRRIASVKTKADVQRQITELEVKALRAQMNPHFIFNAMNSIQQFTLKNDVDNANLYISKFSTLLRKILHSSQQSVIALEEEMEQLNLYLDIEKLRLGSDFVYEVIAGNDLEIDAIKIPGMLVQPFVENAIKHGLALKSGPKKLEVTFTQTGSDHLQVTVTDNGIGITKAKEIKAKGDRLLPYESKGMSLVEQRMKLLENPGADIKLRVDELKNEEGAAAGTRVQMIIPLQATP